MRRWAWMTGGLIVWFVHFMGVYAIASLADVVSRADEFGWRMTGLAFSAASVLSALAITAAGAATASSSSAIVWQALPTVIGY